MVSLQDMTTVRDFVTEHRGDLLADLDAFLRIAGISAQPDQHAEVGRSAEWLAQAFRDVGCPTVEVWKAGETVPGVSAGWPAAEDAAPTVLVSGHHDVRPVAPLELWEPPPFEPTLDGDL